MEAFLSKNKSHFLCFEINKLRRTLHHYGAESFKLHTCAVIFQLCLDSTRSLAEEGLVLNSNSQNTRTAVYFRAFSTWRLRRQIFPGQHAVRDSASPNPKMHQKRKTTEIEMYCGSKYRKTAGIWSLTLVTPR